MVDLSETEEAAIRGRVESEQNVADPRLYRSPATRSPHPTSVRSSALWPPSFVGLAPASSSRRSRSPGRAPLHWRPENRSASPWKLRFSSWLEGERKMRSASRLPSGLVAPLCRRPPMASLSSWPDRRSGPAVAAGRCLPSRCRATSGRHHRLPRSLPGPGRAHHGPAAPAETCRPASSTGGSVAMRRVREHDHRKPAGGERRAGARSGDRGASLW